MLFFFMVQKLKVNASKSGNASGETELGNVVIGSNKSMRTFVGLLAFGPPVNIPPLESQKSPSRTQAFAHAGLRFVLPHKASKTSDVFRASILLLQAHARLSSIVPREQFTGHAACLEVARVVGCAIAKPGRVRIVFGAREADIPASNRRVREASTGNRGVVAEGAVNFAHGLGSFLIVRVRKAFARNRRVVAKRAENGAVPLPRA